MGGLTETDCWHTTCPLRLLSHSVFIPFYYLIFFMIYIYTHTVLLLFCFLRGGGCFFCFGFVSLSSIFSFFKLLFYTYIIPSTLFLSSSFLCDPLYDDVISTRVRRLCGERLCHAHPHSSCWVGRMRRMELREYVWPPPPSIEMNTVTHSSVHCMVWTQRTGQLREYAEGNV